VAPPEASAAWFLTIIPLATPTEAIEKSCSTDRRDASNETSRRNGDVTVVGTINACPRERTDAMIQKSFIFNMLFNNAEWTVIGRATE
jgi:hypothetical protein